MTILRKLLKRERLYTTATRGEEKGNIAYLKYDKLVVKGPITDKRKREISTSPQSTYTTKPKKQQTISSVKSNRKNQLATGKRIIQLNYENQTEEITQPPPSRLVLVGDEDHNPPTTQENNCENSHRRAKIYVAALNVLTLKNDENLTELTHALKQIKWDIVGLSEVRRRGERIISHPDFLLYHIGTTPAGPINIHGAGGRRPISLSRRPRSSPVSFSMFLQFLCLLSTLKLVHTYRERYRIRFERPYACTYTESGLSRTRPPAASCGDSCAPGCEILRNVPIREITCRL
ncbi:hypothetical protein EVAR_92088_1 [Eumeta japonica]|uniref:Craniofacial development protein 2 n=1 Tax=Eumeta variegata TaxID=151549 RepID=A0A4C1SYZ4_EUMVA|nr:hypothetical protein EVAR_92088_1 [Eumeta japonica]